MLVVLSRTLHEEQELHVLTRSKNCIYLKYRLFAFFTFPSLIFDFNKKVQDLTTLRINDVFLLFGSKFENLSEYLITESC